MISAGRLLVEQYDPANGDTIILIQTHRNESNQEVGRIQMDGGEIEDAIYVLKRAKAVRDKSNK